MAKKLQKEKLGKSMLQRKLEKKNKKKSPISSLFFAPRQPGAELRCSLWGQKPPPKF
jgi:hypothetical protein